MPVRTLTDRYCASARVADGDPQTDYFDASLRGLALRVTSAGTKSWNYLSPSAAVASA